MATPVMLPRQGQSVETCLLLSWKKRVGDTVAPGEALCDVETDKATFTVESPGAGTLLAQYYREGQDVPVLSTIALIGTPGETVGDASGETRVAHAAGAPERSAPAATPASRPEAASPAGRRRIASPRATRRANELGVRLTGILGTGPGGRIIERDVLEAAREAAAQPAAPAPKPEPVAAGAPEEAEVVSVRGARRVIAERMLTSLRTTAQLTLHASGDARALQAYRARLKESPEAWGLRGITITDLILYALSRLLPRHPEMNAHFLGDRILRYRAVHLGLAVDTPRGLMVPVIRNAAARSLRDISTEAKRVAAACVEGTARPEDLGGATFTLTNLGALDIESFTPVLNPPEVAILGVGAIRPRPMAAGDVATFVPHIALSLTIDHQAVDGAPGARFLGALARTLASIDTYLAI